MKFVSSLAVLSVLALSVVAPALASTAVSKVQVSLDGEAGQPMTVALDKATVKAGMIEFDVKNVAIATDHEVVLVKLQKAGQHITANAKTHRIDEAKFKTMGEVGGLKPNDSGILKVKLAAGDYVLLCNHKEHFELGMSTPFTVTK